MYPLPSVLLDQVERAIVEDRKQLGRASARAVFAREAVLVVVAAARKRRGGTLPPAPSQLPEPAAAALRLKSSVENGRTVRARAYRDRGTARSG